MGAEAVSGFITHAVFPDDAWKKFVGDGWHTVYLTDSIPEITKQLEGAPLFESGEYTIFFLRHFQSTSWMVCHLQGGRHSRSLALPPRSTDFCLSKITTR
jgi:hypothetical protein